MKIILIKHAETEWNKASIYQGWLDSPLTTSGKNQAKELAKFIKNQADVIISSDLGRSIETAMILSANSGVIKGRNLFYFRERCFGILEGKCKWKIMETNPDWFIHNKLNDNASVPGIEDIEIFKSRLLAGANYLKKLGNKKVAIVTHGGVIKLFYVMFRSAEKIPEIKSCSIHCFNI